LKINNTEVRQSQIAKLEKLKKSRNQQEVDAALAELTNAAKGLSM
jgi:methylmalonyl-CoA mutase